MGGMRLVSLLPSATEIVYALGLGDQLVGVTFECDEPATARAEKTVVVGGRDTRGMTPAEIDEYVKGQLAAGADLYTLHADALAGLDPQLILTQDLCRVCALPSGHVSDALDHLGCRADVLSLDPYTLDEVLDTILAVGDRTGVPERAGQLVAALRDRLAAVAAAVADRPEALAGADSDKLHRPKALAGADSDKLHRPKALAGADSDKLHRPRPRVAVVEWVEPPFTAGHWVPDMVAAAGGEPVAARPGARSVQTTWAEFTAAAPDLLLVTPCGFHLDGAAEQARAAAAHLPGVPVWALDADGLVVRPGPRLVDGVETIAAILHPGAFPPPAHTAAVRVA
jgi:iron complex transport system substrate-binding protein